MSSTGCKPISKEGYKCGENEVSFSIDSQHGDGTSVTISNSSISYSKPAEIAPVSILATCNYNAWNIECFDRR